MKIARSLPFAAPMTGNHPSAKTLGFSLLASVILLAAHPAARATNVIINGDFSSNGGPGQLTVNTTLSNWTGGGTEGTFGSQTTPPVFVFNPGDTGQLQGSGVTGDGFMGTVSFWGATGAPDSGVVIAADGDPSYNGSLSQAVNGLNVGDTYNLTFNWAGAQQQGFFGDTTEKWQVTFGSDIQSTSIVSTPSTSFVGWQVGSLNFTATSPSELLNFRAVGTSSNEQPWLLLDNVQMSDVGAPTPEPGSALLLSIGSFTAVGLRRRRVAA